jgi:hypothetical protein
VRPAFPVSQWHELDTRSPHTVAGTAEASAVAADAGPPDLVPSFVSEENRREKKTNATLFNDTSGTESKAMHHHSQSAAMLGIIEMLLPIAKESEFEIGAVMFFRSPCG